MKKRYWILLIIMIGLIITYFTGPKIPTPVYSEELPELPDDLRTLDSLIIATEAKKPVREDNQARILWANGSPDVNEYSIVYLHGFAGSYRDGYPVNVQVADTLGANIYLSRWAGHGLKPEEALETFSPEAAWASAKEALVIGQKIGKKIIIISTSTGGTLALKLAATYPNSVHALINISPNIEDDVNGTLLLSTRWGYELANLVSFGEHREIELESKAATQYFDTIYPSKALVDLQVLLETTMKKETFKNVHCPVLTLYYYENFLEEDEHVEVEVFPAVHSMISTPEDQKELVQLETPKTHFMGSNLKSRNTDAVLKAIVNFLQETLDVFLQPEPEVWED
ncbi:alpha/beta hydrolase [Zunongwangia sp. F260]|uniref:Alpha/beta hydrolase n=1 Tax=Autumnicola lenta TaxID=3075593 RepID=A0ABU3CME5_9FLAO|nr:alpha/beta hydrolase [Zunongwangia sp. F260]MDT0647528.1 alpha/beta hydrolase [Zunongwangia sp. F260]